MQQRVDAHQVGGAEAGALGAARGRADHGVHLLDVHAQLLHVRAPRCSMAKTPMRLATKLGVSLPKTIALAEPAAEKRGQPGGDGRVGVRLETISSSFM